MKMAIGAPLKMKMTYVKFSFLVKWNSCRRTTNLDIRIMLSYFSISKNLFLASKVQNKNGLSTYLFNCPYFFFSYFLKVNDPYHRLKKSNFFSSSKYIFKRSNDCEFYIKLPFLFTSQFQCWVYIIFF